MKKLLSLALLFLSSFAFGEVRLINPVTPTVNWINVKSPPYGIKGDGVALTSLSMTAGSNVVTSTYSAFGSRDVGKLIGITNSSSTALSGLSITASSWTVTWSGGTWSDADVGRGITIAGAGAAGGTLTSTIVRWISTTKVDIADLATGTVSGAAGTKADMMATTITGYTSPTQVTVALNASFSTSTAAGYMGTDDTSKIQSLINATITAGGGTLYFPRAIYLVTTPNNTTPALTIASASNLSFVGEKGATIQGTYNLLYNLIQATQSSDVSFLGMTFDGGFPLLDPNTFNQIGINYVYNSVRLTVKDCTFQNINDTGIADRSYSMLSNQYANTTTNKKAKTIIVNNRFYNVKTGFNTKLGARWGIVADNHFEYGDCAAKIDGELPAGQSLPEKTADWIISNNVATNMGKIHTTSTGVFELEENISNVTLANNIVSDTNNVDCLKVNGGQTVKDSYSLNITNNICANMANGFGMAFRPDGSGSSTSTIRSVNVIGNLFREVDKANIYFNFNSSGTIQSINISGNEFIDWNLNDQPTGTAEGATYFNNTGLIAGLYMANNVFHVTGSPAVADSAGIVWATTNISSYTITHNTFMNTSNSKLLGQINSGTSLILDGNYFNSGRINALGNLTLKNHYAADSQVACFNASTITIDTSRFIKGAGTNALSSTVACRFEENNVSYEGYTSTFSFSGGAFRVDTSKNYSGGDTTFKTVTGVTNQIGLNGFTTSAGVTPGTATLAVLRAKVPASAGESWYCSDCSTYSICTSTGTGTGAYANPVARTTACQ